MNFVTMIMLSFALFFTSSSCSHGPNENQSRQQTDQGLTPNDDSQENKQPHVLKEGTEKEQEEGTPEEESNLDSKIKAVDDFFKVLDDIMN